MSYVIAAYGFAILLIGGYALSIVLRRRAAERELTAAQASTTPGEFEPGAAPGHPDSGLGGGEAP